MRRSSRTAGGHSTGWKVAYADFVTALMALFLVLWLVESGPETRAAVASYFNHPRLLSLGNRGFLTEEGKLEFQETLRRLREEAALGGGTEAGVGPSIVRGDRQFLIESARELESLIERSPALHGLEGAVGMEFTDEGLRIQIHDQEFKPLFNLGSERFNPDAEELLGAIASVLGPLPNNIVVEGHTDSRPYTGKLGYSNWELSGSRANAARRVLEREGVSAERIVRVVGFADRVLLEPDHPLSDRNRRISIIVRYFDPISMPDPPRTDRSRRD